MKRNKNSLSIVKLTGVIPRLNKRGPVEATVMVTLVAAWTLVIPRLNKRGPVEAQSLLRGVGGSGVTFRA